jgi:hypothetical protein
MLRLLFFALLAYLAAWCVLWVITHAILLVIALLGFGTWNWWQSKNRQTVERP